MTLVDKAALTAALAERDAARAEVARLRAAVEEVLPGCYMFRGSPGAPCLDLIGATWGDRVGAKFTAEMCCDPCKVRAALAATEDQP